MLLYFHRRNRVLRYALQASIAAHRPSVLNGLLAECGPTAFASAISTMSARAIADALSMLPLAARVLVFSRLPYKVRSRHIADGTRRLVTARDWVKATTV